MDIKFIGSGPAAKAILYYITDFITKSQLQAHVAYAALELAVNKLGEFNPVEDDLESRARKLLQKCAHSLISKQELSAQQVVSYLMDFEDHFTSHMYVNLYWTSLEGLLDKEDPTCDYQCRGDLLKNVNIWDFVAQTEKERVRKKKSPLADEDFDMEECDDPKFEGLDPGVDEDSRGPADFVEPDEPTWTRDNILECSGKPLPRVEFWSDHLESDTHVVRVRTNRRRRVPVPIGPALPRRDHESSAPKHARLMLILFKPWRHVTDLRSAGQSWVEAYHEFLRSDCPAEVLDCINNMQILHECKDSRDTHYANRR
ncbi:hypothetical protein DFH09DRAFT_935634, partial [Mycena vulgaris]